MKTLRWPTRLSAPLIDQPGAPMTVIRWAAVAVTALFVLMNTGAVLEPEVDTGYRVVAAVLAIAGAVAAVMLGTNQARGRAAIITVGGLNVLTAITGLFTNQEGAVVGIVVGGLGVLLGMLTGSNTHAQ
jgi:hypothetical protein